MTHDAVTGLPNRNHLHDHIQKVIGSGSLEERSLALLVVNLERFKEINDTLGHHNGDLLLQKVGERLQGHLTEIELLGHLGRDEFAVLTQVTGKEETEETVRQIQETVKAPFVIEGLSLDVTTQIGIALFPDHGEDPNLLLQRADVAISLARKAGEGHAFYDPEGDPYTPRRLIMTSELRHAIENDQLTLHYQPKIDLKDHHISGVEALARWNHPKFGFIPPDQFIPLAEQTGLIGPLTLWVLNEALRQCSVWRKSGLTLAVSVNLSVRNLQDAHLPDHIGKFLEAWEVPVSMLEVEITESTIMANPMVAMDTLTRINEMGVRISIDDFGTGYSSLAYLKKFPATEIKIDKFFIQGVGESDLDSHIVQSTIDLGHNLGLVVVAEGIENELTYDHLTILGCDEVQGYYMSRPLPPADLMEWIMTRPANQGAKKVNKG